MRTPKMKPAYPATSRCMVALLACGAFALPLTLAAQSSGDAKRAASQQANQQNKQQGSVDRDQKAGGDFWIRPETLTFGKTPLFLKRIEDFVVHNGRQSPLHIASVDLGGDNEKLFSIVENQCGKTLAAGQECHVRVGFEPTTEGEKTAQLRLVTEGDAVRTKDITGTGVGAKYSVEPKSIAFGQVKLGTGGEEKVVTITNNGPVNLPITATSLSGENEKQFAQSNDCPRELPIGKSCKSTVLFRPTWKGDHEATLTVWAKGGAPETKVRLTGTGTGADTAGVQRAGSRPSSAD